MKPRSAPGPVTASPLAATRPPSGNASPAMRRSIVDLPQPEGEDQLQTRQVLDYDAVVSKCTPFGCFVEIPELAVSGLVHVSLLSRRFVKYNEHDQSLSAPGAGSWRAGSRLKVHVAKVDFRQRRVDFVPCSR